MHAATRSTNAKNLRRSIMVAILAIPEWIRRVLIGHVLRSRRHVAQVGDSREALSYLRVVLPLLRAEGALLAFSTARS